MNRTLQWISLTGFALLLLACDRQDNDIPEPGASETDARPQFAPLRSAASDERPLDTDTAAPGEPERVAVTRAERQLLRERRQVERGWWSDEALLEQLDLTAEQRAALRAARQTLLEARQEGRTQLLGQRGSERTVEEMEQAEQLAALQQSRNVVRAEMDEAVQAWRRAAREILTAEQIKRLREREPEALPEP